MSDRPGNTAFLLVIAAMAIAIVVLVATAPGEKDRVESIGSQIKCPVCQGESIANSPSQMARDMMALVEERVAAGMSDDAIVAELLFSYSGALLLDPPVAGNTLLLWLAPFAALLAGGLIIFRWRRHPTEQPSPEPSSRSRARVLFAGLALALVFAAVVVIAGFSLQDRAGPTAGVATLDQDDLASVSNETLEAVIAANLDHPQIDGMRLALAGRYVEDGDYRRALTHYLAVAESTVATDPQVVAALVQMGRLVWDGNGEAEVAIALFDQALAIESTSWAALYNKGVVLWCGHGDFEDAAAALRKAMTDGGLPDEVTDVVARDLDAITNGQACT